MRIAILTSGILPVPAVQGGAVENLIDFYLEYNHQHKLHDITVYSVADKAVRNHPALQSDVNHYVFIDMDSWWAKLRKKWYEKRHGKEYYHYSIEYFFQEAFRHVSEEYYDILLIENRPGYALKISRDLGSKVVIHLHNDFMNADTPSIKDIYKRTDKIICISEYIRGRVQTIYDTDRKCATVMNGINLKAFTLEDLPHYKLKNRPHYKLKDDDFVLVFSGRVIPAKGIRSLILAMNELKDYPNIKLMIIGGSFYGNEARKTPFIEELIKLSWDVRQQIIFTGFKPYQEIPSLLSLADIAVLPSVWEEPLGLTCIEAMATGLPVITTNQGGIPETVTADSAVMLHVDETLPQRIATAILDLYEHPEKRKTMSEAAKKRSQLFSKERYAREFFEVLEKL